MIDTMKAYVNLEEPLDTSVFECSSTTENGKGKVEHHWLQQDGVRFDYRVRPSGYQLSVTFSVVSVSHAWMVNPTPEQVQSTLDGIDKYLFDSQSLSIPPIRQWTCQRVDYAWNFNVGQQLPEYMLMLQGLHCSTMDRAVYAQESEGVIWKSNSRWVKFYNKSKRLGGGDAQTVIRYEVSNYADAIRYMCKAWFGCDRTVENLIHRGRALYVLVRFFETLGLTADSYESKASVVRRLREVFGSRSLSALAAYDLITTHGTDVSKYSLMPSSTFYLWRDRLREHGFLTTSEVVLPALSLPVEETLIYLLSENVKNDVSGDNTLTAKNLSDILGVYRIQDDRIPLKISELWREQRVIGAY